MLLPINFIGSEMFFRIDLTSEKRFTLSEATKQLLQQTTEPVYVTIYLDGDNLPTGFKRLRKAVKEMLQEFEAYAPAEFYYNFKVPAAGANAEQKDKIYRQLVQSGLKYYSVQEQNEDGSRKQLIVFPGAVLKYSGKEIPINLLKNTPRQTANQNLNNSIESLEYELANAVLLATQNEKPKIAFIRGHGELHEYHTQDWQYALEEYYQVFRGTIGGKTGVLNDFETIIIAKPTQAFSEADKYVLDQYVMNGGSVLWLVDGAVADMDSLNYRPFTVSMPNDLNLNDMLFKYGVRINTNLLQHENCAKIGLNTAIEEFGEPKIDFYPWFYSPILYTENNHPINKYIEAVKTEFTSSLDTVGQDNGLTKTILLRTLPNTRSVVVPDKISLDLIDLDPKSSEFRLPPQHVAVLLEGQFTSVFKNRAAYLPGIDASQHKDKSVPNKMIVIADGDLGWNEVLSSGKPIPMATNPTSGIEYKGNKTFLVNAVKYLCQNNQLMQLRSRELKIRLLDNKKVIEQRTTWQILTVLVPIFVMVLLGWLFNWLRKRKYAR